MVAWVVYPAVPPHVEYSLIELGHRSTKPLHAVMAWTETHLDRESTAARRRPSSTTRAADRSQRAGPDAVP